METDNFIAENSPLKWSKIKFEIFLSSVWYLIKRFRTESAIISSYPTNVSGIIVKYTDRVTSPLSVGNEQWRDLDVRIYK